MKLRLSEPLRWALRTSVMFFAGVIPAIVMLVLTLALLPLAGIAYGMVVWFSVLTVFALLGIAGLWAATFRDHDERCLPNGVTIALVLCGLVGAVPYLIFGAAEGLEEGGFSLLMAICLLGPVICAIYFLVEQLVLALRRASTSP